MIFISRVSSKTGIIIALLLYAIATQAQPPVNSLKESRTDLFTYFVPGGAAMPYGSELASKSIVHLNTGVPLGAERPNATSGTAFLIRTFLEDTPDSNKVCMCRAGHHVTIVFNPQTPVTGNMVPFNSLAYMDYLGDETVNASGQKLNRVTHFSKGYISTARLLAYRDAPFNGDYALVLVDKRELPSLSFAELGYDFDNVAIWRNNTFYSLGHPWNYPLRIIDTIRLDTLFTGTTRLSVVLPYVAASGSSGAPVLVRPKNPGDPIVSIALLSGLYFEQLDSFVDLSGQKRMYGFSLQASKLNLMEQAIRTHCWNKRDSADISATGSYKRTVTISNINAGNAFNQNWSLSTTATLVRASTSLFPSDPGQSLKITRLNANICNFTGFLLPSIYPDENKSWQAIIAAKEINLSSDFSYEASGISELNLTTVVISAPMSSISKQLSGIAETQTTGNEIGSLFTVYPNPSPDGLFYLQTPAGKSYRTEVLTLDGKTVYHSSCTGNPCQLQLSSVVRGSYLLTVYAVPGNEPVYKKIIIY